MQMYPNLTYIQFVYINIIMLQLKNSCFKEYQNISAFAALRAAGYKQSDQNFKRRARGYSTFYIPSSSCVHRPDTELQERYTRETGSKKSTNEPKMSSR